MILKLRASAAAFLMVQKLQAAGLSLHSVKGQFGLKLADDEQFLTEFQEQLPDLSNLEKRLLDQVKADFLHLYEHPMVEGLTKMVVLSPLLMLSGFYRPPFRIAAGPPTAIVADTGGSILEQIDVLILQEQFWILVVESNQAEFSLRDAITYALSCMMARPLVDRATYGLATNGSHFIFLKLSHQGSPHYALSDEFSLLRRSNDLHRVLSILKKLSSILRHSGPTTSGPLPANYNGRAEMERVLEGSPR